MEDIVTRSVNSDDIQFCIIGNRGMTECILALQGNTTRHLCALDAFYDCLFLVKERRFCSFLVESPGCHYPSSTPAFVKWNVLSRDYISNPKEISTLPPKYVDRSVGRHVTVVSNLPKSSQSEKVVTSMSFIVIPKLVVVMRLVPFIPNTLLTIKEVGAME